MDDVFSAHKNIVHLSSKHMIGTVKTFFLFFINVLLRKEDSKDGANLPVQSLECSWKFMFWPIYIKPCKIWLYIHILFITNFSQETDLSDCLQLKKL